MLAVLGEAAIRSLLLAALVQSVVWLSRIRHPQLLLATWTVTLLASFMMPVFPHFIPVGIPLDPELPGPLMTVAADLLQQPLLPPGHALAELRVPSLAWPWLETVYAVVCCGILSRVLLGIGLSFRLLARAVPAWPEWAAGQRVRISSDVAGPVTIAHVILLPADAVAWPAEMRRAVLAHEQAHVARWDFALLVVSQLNRAVFWFSPLSWWLHRRLVNLSELASDDQAMAATRDRLGYAEILLEMGRRSSPAPRGPAMARPSTLLNRIERIILDEASLRGASRTERLLLTAGMAGLSIGIAGLAHGPALSPASLPSIARTTVPDVQPDPVAPPILEQASGSQPGVPARIAETAPMPQVIAAAAQPTHPAAPAASPSPRSAVRAPPVPRSAVRLGASPAAQTGPNEGPSARPRNARTLLLPAVAGAEGLAASGAPVPHDVKPSPPHQPATASLSLPSNLEEIGGATCTGTVAVGLKAVGGVPGRPNVVPGQAVPAQAQFFRKEGGTLWVRFNAFGRPPLDLPVRFARNGMTWTGEYGIAYTVQAAGGNRLAGLAALVANDSAGLAFACSRPAIHSL